MARGSWKDLSKAMDTEDATFYEAVWAKCTLNMTSTKNEWTSLHF
jgi:hypothetical protein